MVLCYCRLMYVEFTVSQTMEHFLACHQHAFEAFGGVPSKVMVDNLKSAVLRRSLGQAPVFNPKYAADVTVKNMWRSIQNLRGQQRFDVLCAT
jgi:transposase